jgi:hypothetical protein
MASPTTAATSTAEDSYWGTSTSDQHVDRQGLGLKNRSLDVTIEEVAHFFEVESWVRQVNTCVSIGTRLPEFCPGPGGRPETPGMLSRRERVGVAVYQEDGPLDGTDFIDGSR